MLKDDTVKPVVNFIMMKLADGCQGKKDFASVKEHGKRVYKQK
jgi:hypothetical protein